MQRTQNSFKQKYKWKGEKVEVEFRGTKKGKLFLSSFKGTVCDFKLLDGHVLLFLLHSNKET